MKILHTSDWHLGKSLGGHSLVEDQRHALEQVMSHVLGESFDLLVIAGDIFDRATPSGEAARMLGDWLGDLRAEKPDLPVVIIAGNHDNGPRLAWTASVMDRQHIYLRGDTERIDEPIRIRGKSGVEAEVWALPFLLPGSLDEATPSQVGAMDEAIARIAAKQDRGRAQVLVAHCFVREGLVSDSERVLIGTATQIDPAVFAPFDYVALGHLHRPQHVGTNARYSGSLVRYSFSETGHEKATVAVEVAPGQPHRHTMRPIKSLHRMSRIKGTLEALRDDPKYADRTDDYVELTLDPPVSTGNPLEELRTRWNHILGFENRLVSSATALSRVGDAAGPRDLEADFQAFDAQFPAGEAAPEELLTAFRGLHADMQREEIG